MPSPAAWCRACARCRLCRRIPWAKRTRTRSATSPTGDSFNALQALVGDLDRLDDHLVTARVHTRSFPLAGPPVLEVVADHLGSLVVVSDDRAILPGALDVPVQYLLAPVPEALVVDDAALQDNVAPLGVTGDLDHLDLAIFALLTVLDDLGLVGEALGFPEERGLDALDLQSEV